jgi:hypothetical protein
MATCPKCHLPNPDGSDACIWCGQHQFGKAAASTVEAAMPAGVVAPNGVTPEPVAPDAAALAPSLPSPLVEPILTPATSPPDYKPLPSHMVFARPLGAATVADVPNAPAARPEAPRPGPAPTHAGTYLTGPPGSSHLILIPGTEAPTDPATPPPPPAALRPKLVVIRGQKVNAEYPVYEGRNVIGRFADRPVDIDLVSQEPEGQIWSSRQHAALTFDKNVLLIEDLNSLNGTWISGARLHPGQQKLLKPGDVIQIGTVQMRVVMG